MREESRRQTRKVPAPPGFVGGWRTEGANGSWGQSDAESNAGEKSNQVLAPEIIFVIYFRYDSLRKVVRSPTIEKALVPSRQFAVRIRLQAIFPDRTEIGTILTDWSFTIDGTAGGGPEERGVFIIPQPVAIKRKCLLPQSQRAPLSWRINGLDVDTSRRNGAAGGGD